MEVMVVVHRAGPRMEGWAYDVLVRLSGRERRKLEAMRRLASELNRRLRVVDVVFPAEPPAREVCDYVLPCDVVKRYEAEGWVYVCGGDTLHTREYLAAMGLKDEDGLDGLIAYLKRTLNPDRLVVEDPAADHGGGGPSWRGT